MNAIFVHLSPSNKKENSREKINKYRIQVFSEGGGGLVMLQFTYFISRARYNGNLIYAYAYKAGIECAWIVTSSTQYA